MIFHIVSLLLTTVTRGADSLHTTPPFYHPHVHHQSKQYRSVSITSSRGFPLYDSQNPENSDSDFINGNDKNKEDSIISDDLLFAELHKRQAELQSQTKEIEQRWCNADCQTTVPLQLDDWIRRIALDKWPIVAVGTAGGSVRVADVSTGKVRASVLGAHAQVGGDPKLLDVMYGKYDGGGVVAVAMQDDIVVSAGREGGVKIWKFDHDENKLVSQGQPKSLDEVQVTSLTFDDFGGLWVGSFDNKLRKFDIVANSSPLRVTKPIVLQFDSAIVSVATNSDIGLCVCGMEDGYLHFISIASGEVLGSWKPFRLTPARSVAIVEGPHEDTYYVACGGGDGTMHIRTLALNADGEIAKSSPFHPTSKPQEIRPPHAGPVVAMAPRKGGLFVSGAHDGSLRLWDCRGNNSSSASSAPSTRLKPHPKALYHLIGYKVWLGSICIDEEGLRLFSDGSDNSVIVHDFSTPDDRLMEE